MEVVAGCVEVDVVAGCVEVEVVAGCVEVDVVAGCAEVVAGCVEESTNISGVAYSLHNCNVDVIPAKINSNALMTDFSRFMQSLDATMVIPMIPKTIATRITSCEPLTFMPPALE